jgi:hypothetical protein
MSLKKRDTVLFEQDGQKLQGQILAISENGMCHVIAKSTEGKVLKSFKISEKELTLKS